MAAQQSTNDIRSFTHTAHSSILDKIKCFETINVEDLEALLNSDLLNTTKWSADEWGFEIELENERQQIEKILKKTKSTKSKNKVNIVPYYYNKKYNVGRVYPFKSLGLCAVRCEVRHTLAHEHYYDIDIENAHPSILLQIAQKENVVCNNLNLYVSNREKCLNEIMNAYKVSRKQAKNLIIRLCYGGLFEDWCKSNDVYCEGVLEWVEGLTKELNNISNIVWERNPHLHTITEKKRSPRRSALSIFAQDIERTILENMFNFFVSKKIIKKNRQGAYGCVLCFDGIMIPQENVTTSVDEMIQDLRTYIMKHTSLILNFTEKPMNEGYDLNLVEMEGIDEEVCVMGQTVDKAWVEGGVETDLEAGEKVFKMYPFWKYHTKTENLYVFDRDTGLWSADKMTHRKIISQLSPYLRVVNGNGELGVRSYGNTKTLMDKVFDFLKTKCIDDSWFRQKENSSLGYVLFTNGYVDMKKMKFRSKEKYGFNPDIVFFGRINRPFVRGECDKVEEVIQKLFYNALGEEQGKYMILFLARALAGDIDMKKMLFGLGVGNSGKGTITKALQLALDDYCATWNAGCMAYSRSSNDEAQKLRWVMNIAKARIAITNEISSEQELDGNIIKKLASGGDALIARQHGKNETEFTPHFSSLVLVNDLPKIRPYDDAVDNRVRVTSFEKAYVDEPTNKYEMKKDDAFCKSIYEDEFKNALVSALFVAYKEYVDAGCVMYEPQSVKCAKTEWLGESRGVMDVFLNDFEVSNSPDDFVTNEDIEAWLKERKTGITIRKFNKELKKYAELGEYKNVVSERKKLNGRTVRGFKGVCLIDNTDEE